MMLFLLMFQICGSSYGGPMFCLESRFLRGGCAMRPFLLFLALFIKCLILLLYVVLVGLQTIHMCTKAQCVWEASKINF